MMTRERIIFVVYAVLFIAMAWVFSYHQKTPCTRCAELEQDIKVVELELEHCNETCDVTGDLKKLIEIDTKLFNAVAWMQNRWLDDNGILLYQEEE